MGMTQDGAVPGKMRRVSIAQGEYVVLGDPNAVITTVLGSCVSACIRDPKLGIGGMNHFVLPEPHTPSGAPVGGDVSRYGSHLMNQLVDDLLAHGADLRRLEAKVFGGASPWNSYYNVGERNVRFALAFLAQKRIAVIETQFGGVSGCKLNYWPVSGKAEYLPLKPEKIATPSKVIQLKRVLPL
ncbi:chemotaxis protein CheD [Allorhizobium terrae]|uniref:Probable chemoreceptor glutamine deamidase CheD n=2 Tax=Allorhizobium terrae TaxID=1848972 RepID=A0A4S4A147_9HYPH|nr:chemotaxis protein CheD [Allorhizobium terrae]